MGNTKQPSNQELILGFKKNNTLILEDVYKRVFPKIKSHILKNNGDEDQAKDIFQEAFISCWKNIKEDKFAVDGNIEGYLYTIGRNKWTDYLRSANYKKTISENRIIEFQDHSEDETLENLEKEDQYKRIALRQALSRLGNECKTVLQLFYFERKSMDVISKELNIASTSARNKKYRCMEKLRILSLEIKNNG